MTRPRKVYTDNDGNKIYVQTLKSKGTWQWSGKGSDGKLLSISTVRRIMATGHFQKHLGSFAHLSALESAKNTRKRVRSISVPVKGPVRRGG